VTAVAKSSKSRRRRKSKKPYAGFPLTHHPSGRWRKIHNGTAHYFGPTNDDGTAEEYEKAWRAALERYKREWPLILDGREVPPEDDSDGGLRMADLANEFLNVKRTRLDSGELSSHSFKSYHATCAALVAFFGDNRRVDDLRPDDFERYRKKLASRYGVVGLKNEINRCRVAFKFAFDHRLIDRPVNYGQSFDKPSRLVLLRARNEAGPRMFEAEELRTILKALDGGKMKVDDKEMKFKADPVLKAMVLLAANGGFGNTDVASLPQSAVDFDSGWCSFPRPKTGIARRFPLWPETAVALRAAITVRPKPKDPSDDRLCFLTRLGKPWVRVAVSIDDDGNEKHVPADAVSPKFANLLRKLKINGRKRLNFYTLRHVFQTIGGDAKDPDAVSSIMGHSDQSMAGVYRERISDERLRDVVDTVRAWLWPEIAKPMSERLRRRRPQADA
jgi:integrase